MPSALPPPGKPRSKLRRRFLISVGALGGAMAVGLWSVYRKRDRLAPPSSLQARQGEAILTAWIKIASDGRVTVEVPRQEMGQGVTTSLPMLVAEELDADFNQVRFEQSPVDPVYANATMLGDGVPFRTDDSGWMAAIARVTQFKLGEMMGIVATGGSSSVRDAWLPMRRAGATARAMLVQAAGQRFGVPAADCVVRNGVVEHAGSGKRASFGELALEAARLPIPAEVTLKDPARFRLLGKPLRRLDIPEKVDGTAQFALDVRLPGLLYAAIAQCPVFGGTVRSYNADKARNRPGVKGVLRAAGHQHIRRSSRGHSRALLAGQIGAHSGRDRLGRRAECGARHHPAARSLPGAAGHRRSQSLRGGRQHRARLREPAAPGGSGLLRAVPRACHHGADQLYSGRARRQLRGVGR